MGYNLTPQGPISARAFNSPGGVVHLRAITENIGQVFVNIGRGANSILLGLIRVGYWPMLSVKIVLCVSPVRGHSD